MNTELIDAAELGEEARRFVESPLGKAMIDLAAQEVWLAQDALLRVNPTDAEEIRKLQNKAWLGNTFKQWIEEIIDKGDSALEVFKHEQA